MCYLMWSNASHANDLKYSKTPTRFSFPRNFQYFFPQTSSSDSPQSMPISFLKCVALDVLQNQRGTLIILGEQFFIDNGGLVFKKEEELKSKWGLMGWKIIKGKGQQLILLSGLLHHQTNPHSASTANSLHKIQS